MPSKLLICLELDVSLLTLEIVDGQNILELHLMALQQWMAFGQLTYWGDGNACLCSEMIPGVRFECP